jgi:uncharacterized damage-inducible protein DinB
METVKLFLAYYGSVRKRTNSLADGYENVLTFFDRSHYETLDIIRDLADEDLKCNCFTPTGAEVNIGKWLQLLAEHEIHHRAQLYIYLNMLAVKTPPMYGLTSEELASAFRPSDQDPISRPRI